MSVYVLVKFENNKQEKIHGIFDSLDKARAYRIGREYDLLEDFSENTSTTYEVQEWEVL